MKTTTATITVEREINGQYEEVEVEVKGYIDPGEAPVMYDRNGTGNPGCAGGVEDLEVISPEGFVLMADEIREAEEALVEKANEKAIGRYDDYDDYDDYDRDCSDDCY